MTNVRAGSWLRAGTSVVHACILILAGAVVVPAQALPTRFETRFENAQISVFSLNLAPGRHAPVFQNTHDIFWIAINSGRVSMSGRDDNKTPIVFRAGEARFFRSFQTSTIINNGSDVFRGVLVQIKARALTSECACDGAAASAVCGCPGAAPLPDMWAVGVGSVVIGGATLAPRQSFERAAERGNMLLIAISPLTLSDDAAHRSIRLHPGEVRWIDAGLHKFRNLGSTPARYVTLEF